MAEQGQEIMYNLANFFEMYAEKPGTHSSTLFRCRVVKRVGKNIMIINVELPAEVAFTDKAYDLGRCYQETNHSWNLAVVVDEKLVSRG
jgi:hypothetical protein